MPRWRAPDLTPDEIAALDQIEAMTWPDVAAKASEPDPLKPATPASKRPRKKPPDSKDQLKFT